MLSGDSLRTPIRLPGISDADGHYENPQIWLLCKVIHYMHRRALMYRQPPTSTGTLTSGASGSDVSAERSSVVERIGDRSSGRTSSVFSRAEASPSSLLGPLGSCREAPGRAFHSAGISQVRLLIGNGAAPQSE